MISLGIISVGLALINTIAMNMILLLTPKQFGGVVIGIVQVFMFTGMAIGPVTSSLYLQSYQTTICNEQECSLFPSSNTFNLIFLTAATVSIAFIIIGLILKKSIPSNVANPSPSSTSTSI